MTEFEFDTRPHPGTNRSAAVTDCPTCQGHRLVQVGADEVYARCPSCNPAPTSSRPPVEAKGWWKD